MYCLLHSHCAYTHTYSTFLLLCCNLFPQMAWLSSTLLPRIKPRRKQVCIHAVFLSKKKIVHSIQMRWLFQDRRSVLRAELSHYLSLGHTGTERVWQLHVAGNCFMYPRHYLVKRVPITVWGAKQAVSAMMQIKNNQRHHIYLLYTERKKRIWTKITKTEQLKLGLERYHLNCPAIDNLISYN